MKPILFGAILSSFFLFNPVAQAENPEHVQKLIKSRSCPRCDLQGADLSAVNLKNANLEGANLSQANLNLADLSGANLANAVLTGASLAWTDLTSANLDNANLSQSRLEGGERLGQALTFKKAILPNGTVAHP